MKRKCTNRVLLYVAGTGGFLIAAAILFAFNPAKVKFFPACPVHSMTGFYCPGCGSLRALHQLVHGNITEALSMNPLMVLSLPFLGFLFARPSAGYHVWLPWFCFAVLILYGILRNIPLFPFTELAPH